MGLPGLAAIETGVHGLVTPDLTSDSVFQRLPSIQGLGPIGGGTPPPSRPANPLSELFPNGSPPENAGTLAEIVEKHGLGEELAGGTVLAWLEEVGGNLPRFHTLSQLPVNYGQLYRTVLNVDDWAEWMPAFSMSRSKGPIAMGQRIQEAQTGTDIRMFHYQVRVKNSEIPGGFQIVWGSDGEDFALEPGKTGLKINDGAWTFGPLGHDRTQTLMAYQIHVEPDIMDLFVKTTRMFIERAVLNQFNEVIAAMANRTLDASWTKDAKKNPCGVTYQIRRV
jgi:hypothetical protein